jgi:hypothetical protein
MRGVIVLLQAASLACGTEHAADETRSSPNEARGSSGSSSAASGDQPGGPAPIAIDAGSSPAAGAYAERAPLLAPNSEMAVTTAAGKIYVLGGYPASRDVQTTVQVYDPATDTWRLAAPMPVPTHHPVAVGLGDRIYSLGGQLDGDVETARAFVLDPSATPGPSSLRCRPREAAEPAS